MLVETTSGTDVIISQMQPEQIAVETPAGQISTDAKLAVISFAEGAVASASVAEGTGIAVDGNAVEVTQLPVDPELTAQAPVE
jgi:hypothetical protein